MKLTESNGIVGTMIFDIATINIDLFSWQGEDLTFEYFRANLILS